MKPLTCRLGELEHEFLRSAREMLAANQAEAASAVLAAAERLHEVVAGFASELQAAAPSEPEKGYGEAVDAFAETMLQQLMANKGRGPRVDWLNVRPVDLLANLRRAVWELDADVDQGSAERIEATAAAVANRAMMIADWFAVRGGQR